MISEPYVLPSEGGGCRAGTRFASEVGVAAIFSSSAPGARPRELSCGEDFVIAGWGSRAPREGSTSASRVSASPQRRTTSLSRYLGQADIFSDVLVRPPIKRGARPRLGFASVPAFVLLEAGKVTVGWVRARVVLPPKRKAVCFRCLNPGHLGARCPKREGRVEGAQERCFRCGAAGHLARDCANRFAILLGYKAKWCASRVWVHRTIWSSKEESWKDLLSEVDFDPGVFRSALWRRSWGVNRGHWRPAWRGSFSPKSSLCSSLASRFTRFLRRTSPSTASAQKIFHDWWSNNNNNNNWCHGSDVEKKKRNKLRTSLPPSPPSPLFAEEAVVATT